MPQKLQLNLRSHDNNLGQLNWIRTDSIEDILKFVYYGNQRLHFLEAFNDNLVIDNFSQVWNEREFAWFLNKPPRKSCATLQLLCLFQIVIREPQSSDFRSLCGSLSVAPLDEKYRQTLERCGSSGLRKHVKYFHATSEKTFIFFIYF